MRTHGKACEQPPPHRIPSLRYVGPKRPHLWPCNESGQVLVNLGDELIAKAGPLLVIPLRGAIDIV